MKGELLDMMSVHDNRIPPMGPAFQEPSLLMVRKWLSVTVTTGGRGRVGACDVLSVSGSKCQTSVIKTSTLFDYPRQFFKMNFENQSKQLVFSVPYHKLLEKCDDSLRGRVFFYFAKCKISVNTNCSIKVVVIPSIPPPTMYDWIYH